MNDGYPTQAPINTGRLVALITGAAITLGALGCTTLAASGVITSTNATEATVGGAGAITTAGGIFATKKIISASTVTGTQLVSTVATGTAPLTVASTTVVANLNASLLNGTTWAAPGAIGGTTPAAVACTTLTASDDVIGSGINSRFGSGNVQLSVGNAGSGYPDIGYNVVRSSGTTVEKYRINDTAARITIGNNTYPFVFAYAAAGTAGNDITYTNWLTCSSTGLATFSGKIGANGAADSSTLTGYTVAQLITWIQSWVA